MDSSTRFTKLICKRIAILRDDRMINNDNNKKLFQIGYIVHLIDILYTTNLNNLLLHSAVCNLEIEMLHTK